MTNKLSKAYTSGNALYLAGNDIDTDRIIPARFMKCVTFDELGQYVFYDLRFAPNGEKTDSPLNQLNIAVETPAKATDLLAPILITDNNFGCGSSREHAPQALLRSGVKAIIAGSFAEIFFGNCTTLGIPCVTMLEEDRNTLIKWLIQFPDAVLSIDLAALQLNFQKKNETAISQSLKVELKESARQTLLAGTYDPLQKLLSAQKITHSKAQNLGYIKPDTL